MPKITPCLWFDTQAEDAAKYYVGIFPNSSIVTTLLTGDAGPGPKGSVLTVDFNLDGKNFIALNGGPQFKFSEAISMSVDCESQDQVDLYWQKLSAGGEEGQCGWLKDRYGLSWQIVPTILPQMLKDPDQKKADRVMRAMMKMKKLEIPALKKAYEG
jgi:predicted 3-demethylubiquinone-9 3-methyltransferase (glyoxalase superfamily)